MLTITKPCMKALTILGWFVHGVALIMVVSALADETWLVRETRGESQGLFHCCPVFKCDDNGIQPPTWKIEGVDAVIALLILGLLLAVSGGLSSILTAMCTWRTEKNMCLKLVYGIAVVIATGGLFLIASAITFVTTLPRAVKVQMNSKCQISFDGNSYDIKTGYAFRIFISGSAAFCLSAVLIFVGAPRIRKPVMRGDIVDPESNVRFEVPLRVLHSGSVEGNSVNRTQNWRSTNRLSNNFGSVPSGTLNPQRSNMNGSSDSEHFSRTESPRVDDNLYSAEHSDLYVDLTLMDPSKNSVSPRGYLPSYSDAVSDDPPPYTPRFPTDDPVPPYTERG